VANAPVDRVYWDAVSVLLLSPIIVCAAALVEPPAWLRPAATFLGLTSYAVYALHYPLVVVVNSIFRARLAATPNSFYLGFSLLAALLFGCWLVDKYYDFPVRRWLSTVGAPTKRSQLGCAHPSGDCARKIPTVFNARDCRDPRSPVSRAGAIQTPSCDEGGGTAKATCSFAPKIFRRNVPNGYKSLLQGR
jgi:hypothetical protein